MVTPTDQFHRILVDFPPKKKIELELRITSGKLTEPGNGIQNNRKLRLKLARKWNWNKKWNFLFHAGLSLGWSDLRCGERTEKSSSRATCAIAWNWIGLQSVHFLVMGWALQSAGSLYRRLQYFSSFHQIYLASCILPPFLKLPPYFLEFCFVHRLQWPP